MLARDDHGHTLIQRLHRKLDDVCERGFDLVFQWVPSHVGLPGNDRLAREAPTSPVPLSLVVTPFDFARHSMAGYLPDTAPRPARRWRQSPEAAAAQGLEPSRSSSAPALPHRLLPDGGEDTPTLGCADVETLDRVLLQCPAHAAERGALATTYRRLELPSDSTRALLFPATPLSIARRAFSALLEYLEDTNLSSRL
ncbi:hypothetical protein HPB49_006451 [Dermacentor silvarum]|uniref:Uncharacterized protein n=1 Tax=Dermacentor silvarum TaxID=543639 RepID=A0ACB8C7P3_DERSI|nr:hypothetical protein HPB49_006451 [Dermacentor silvarum]